MSQDTINNAMFPDCPIRQILSRIGNKWALLVFYSLVNAGKDSLRFKELQQLIPDVSQKMLTSTLRTLEEDGYVTRTVFPEVPPRVEYALTARAQSLLPHINALVAWAMENKASIMMDRKRNGGRYDK